MQISLCLHSCEVSYIAFCSGQQQGARWRRHLNNPVCSWSSRAKAHCPDGNRNIFEMKWPHLFPEPRVEFWRGFSLALSRHRSGLTHHPRIPFLLDLHSVRFFLFVFLVKMRRGWNFITDAEGDCLWRDPMCVRHKEVVRGERCGISWFMKEETGKKKHPPWGSYNTPPNITVQSHCKNIYKLVLVANKLNEFKLSR